MTNDSYSLNLNAVTSILIFARASVSFIPSSITFTGIVLFGGKFGLARRNHNDAFFA